MKSVLMSVVLLASPAFAAFDNSSGEAEVSYVSWCEGSKVMGETRTGEVYLSQDCADLGLVCKTSETYRPHLVIVAASCQAK